METWSSSAPRTADGHLCGELPERAALRYAQAIAWDAALADDQVWEDLHRHFTEAQLVELGFFIGLTLGQQRWIKTLGLGHREYLADTEAGLAPTTAGM